jgi:hypothetical protein
MKIFKKIGAGILGLLTLLLIIVVFVLVIDSCNTSYLKRKKLPGAEKNSYVISNVNIIPMTSDTVWNGYSIKIVDGIINAIGQNLDAGDLPVIDGGGRFLLPGLMDMHVHVWDRYELGLYLANGVTAVRNVWGMPMHLRMKKDINNGEIIAPLLYTTGPKLTGPEFVGDDNLQLYSPEEGRKKVISYKERGYDFIKTYYGLTKDIYDAIIDQAKISGMDIVAHPSQEVPYAYHFNPQIVSIEHAEDIVQEALDYQLDSIQLNAVVAAFSNSSSTSFCPTLIAFYNIYNMLQDDSILSSVPVQFMNASVRAIDSKSQFQRWHSSKLEDTGVIARIKNQHNFHLYAIKKLNDAGVNIICGTDAGIGVTVPGFSIHEELNFYKQAGLTNYEVLKTATVNASKTHRIMNNMGTIEKGKLANLLLVKQNPLEDLAALQEPEYVFVKGIRVERKTLNKFIEKARNRPNLVATMIRYAENGVVEK